MSETSEAGAGWRIDPADPRIFRYFDGTAWTEHTAPAVAQTVYGTAPYSGMSTAYPTQAAPPRTLSVIAMVLSLSSILVALILSVIGVMMAIGGLVVGIIASRREPHAKPFWLTGIIVGAGVVVLAVGGGIVILVVFATYASTPGY